MTSAVEYELYLPSTDPGVLRDLRRDLIAQFGGLTDTRLRQEGIWRFGATEFRDEIVVWRVLSDRGEAGDRFMSEIRARLERALEQEKILIVRRDVATL